MEYDKMISAGMVGLLIGVALALTFPTPGPRPLPTEAEMVAYERMAKAIGTAKGECK